MTGHITLQSSVGDFDEGFRRRLPAVEKAMLDQGLDPSVFIISRNLAQSPHLPIFYRPDGNLLEYTVFVKGRSFTVTQPNDLAFLEYFYALCVAHEHKDEPHSLAHAVHNGEKKLQALIGRLERWLDKPI
jgi:hypothetical protein